MSHLESGRFVDGRPGHGFNSHGKGVQFRHFLLVVILLALVGIAVQLWFRKSAKREQRPRRGPVMAIRGALPEDYESPTARIGPHRKEDAVGNVSSLNPKPIELSC